MRAKFLLLNFARQCPDLCFYTITSCTRRCQSHFINYPIHLFDVISTSERAKSLSAPPLSRLARNEESSIVVARREIHQGDISTKMFCFFRGGLRQKSHFTFPRNSLLPYVGLRVISTTWHETRFEAEISLSDSAKLNSSVLSRSRNAKSWLFV